MDLLGADNQWLPILVIENNENLVDPIAIINYLAKEFGGAAAHP